MVEGNTDEDVLETLSSRTPGFATRALLAGLWHCALGSVLAGGVASAILACGVLLLSG